MLTTNRCTANAPVASSPPHCPRAHLARAPTFHIPQPPLAAGGSGGAVRQPGHHGAGAGGGRGEWGGGGWGDAPGAGGQGAAAVLATVSGCGAGGLVGCLGGLEGVVRVVVFRGEGAAVCRGCAAL